MRGELRLAELISTSPHDRLADAQKRVEEMERERRKLDRQLDLAQEKTKRANLGQEVLEAKMRVRSFVIGSKMAQYV